MAWYRVACFWHRGGIGVRRDEAQCARALCVARPRPADRRESGVGLEQCELERRVVVKLLQCPKRARDA
eukprot:556999-Prymnesium_polylepis.2